MKIRLWKGYHSPELFSLVRQSWRDSELLILCPPLLYDYSFLGCLPETELFFLGDFTEEEKSRARLVPTKKQDSFPKNAVLGVFTSGTMSATPRLALYTKKNIESSLQAIFPLFDRSRIKSIYCFPQAFHTFGLTLGYVQAHLLDCPLITPPGKYSATSLEHRLLLDEKNILTLGTPTHFFDLIRMSQDKMRFMTASYSCIVGGAAVSRELWLRIRDILQIEAPSIGYGCTEASPGITHLAPGMEPLVDGEIGFPLSSLKSNLIPDRGVEISGPSLCAGLIQNGELLTPEKILVRDQIEVAANGRWIYGGRTDLVLNRGGQKFSLEQIETRLGNLLQTQIIAAAVPNTRLGHDLGVAIQHDDFDHELLRQAQSQIAELFGFQLRDENCIFLPHFPLNESAKTDRQKISLMLIGKRGFS